MSDFEIEWKKMLAGEIYDATSEPFVRKLFQIREKIYDFNALRPSQVEEMEAIVRSLLGGIGEKFHINQPFRCDYGENIYIGENFFANFNLTILDEAEVRIGDNVFIGPNVSIYTACHPLDAKTRNSGVEWAEPVTIGNNVWIGGGVTFLPGSSVGNDAVVGAGSVVTRNFPDKVLVAGNPARIVKTL